jgi:hypothetical protein
MRPIKSALIPVLLTPFTWHTDESWRFNSRLTCRASAVPSCRRFPPPCEEEACAVECETELNPEEAMSRISPSVYWSVLVSLSGRSGRACKAESDCRFRTGLMIAVVAVGNRIQGRCAGWCSLYRKEVP